MSFRMIKLGHCYHAMGLYYIDLPFMVCLVSSYCVDSSFMGIFGRFFSKLYS